MENVQDIALWFLSKNSMTHKKIQKLCYYAQAWHCALYSEKLFSDEIQAWVHGPVIPTLYPIYADYGWNEISSNSFDESKFNEKTLALLNAVYDTYGQFSGDQLESLTHSEDPWRNARGDLNPWDPCTKPISYDSMHDYYLEKYGAAQND